MFLLKRCSFFNLANDILGATNIARNYYNNEKTEQYNVGDIRKNNDSMWKTTIITKTYPKITTLKNRLVIKRVTQFELDMKYPFTSIQTKISRRK